MSDSEQQKEAEVCETDWPENGDAWSDAENETSMDCELLQPMVEEDEEINVFNEETFGMDLDPHGSTDNLSCGNIPFGKSLPQTAPPELEPKPPSPRKAIFSPPRHRPPYLPRASLWLRSRGRGQRGGLGRQPMFEDPAVMRIVEGKQNLMTLDTSIVDCGPALCRNTIEDRIMPPFRKNRNFAGSILQDSAVVCVIGHRGRGQNINSSFSDIPYPISSYRGGRGEPRESYTRRDFGQRATSTMYTPMVPGSPIFPRQPLTPRYFNQTGGMMFPPNRPCSSTPQPLTPKMMQLRFGANSPRPSPFYSPPSNPVQPFRYRGPVTQLHPQHKRLLGQKQRLIHRKLESSDPFCNLMTLKEKEWLIRLQMIQLQSENPYLEDYYYQEYFRRIEAKMAEEELGIRSKREPPKLTTPYITKTDTYTPVVHIEGSLGQVAVSTCYSPRRAISAVHAVHAISPTEEQKDIRKERLEILSKIEKLFMALLEVEEMERTKTSVNSEAEERRLMEKIQSKAEHIYSQLGHNSSTSSGEEFLPFLFVRKGKRLLSRLLPFLNHDLAQKFLHVVTCNLPTLMSKDTDEALPMLYPPLQNVIGNLTFSQLICVLKHVTTSESVGTYESLSLACRNKFGLSLLYALLSHGEKLLSSSVPLEPSLGDFETWTDIIFQVAGELSQCSLVEPLAMPSNLLTLFCRYLDKRTIHQLKSNMESATGYLALPS